MSSDDRMDRRSPADPGLPGPAPEERQRPTGKRNKQGIRVDPEAEAEPAVRRTVISALVEHEPGVLSDVSGLFSRRQFNIESLTVGPTTDDDYARITLVVEEPDPGIDQVETQLQKLLSVVSVQELAPDAMRRELALVKVDATHPDQVAAVADMYDAKATDAGAETATFEVTGSRQKVEAALAAFERFGIEELVRTGTAALARGTERTADYPEAFGAGPDGGEEDDE
jgi:acetolactate synthase-1/3 small subunit